MFGWKGLDRSIYEISVLYDLGLFDFNILQALVMTISLHLIIRPSLKLRRQLIAQMFQAVAVKVKHDLLLDFLQVTQSKI